MPAHEIMQQSEFVYYESDERGLRVHLGEKGNVQFSQEADRPWMAVIKINRREDGELKPIEKKWDLVRALEHTSHFEKGKIRYVPSPEERRRQRKRERQDAACEDLRASLSGGIVAVPLDEMDEAKLKALAEKIGAPLHGQTGRELDAAGLRRSIAGRLGIAGNEVAPAPQVAAKVETEAKEGPSLSDLAPPKPKAKPGPKPRGRKTATKRGK